MKKSLFIFFLFFSFTLQAQHAERLYKDCLPAIVKISVINMDGTESGGTGFFIGERTVVTCYHMVTNLNTIEIQNHEGKSFTADSVIAANKTADLIKFTVKEKNSCWLKLPHHAPQPGESVFIIGNPGEYDYSITGGIVSAVRMRDSVRVIQTTAPCSHGSSGSPLLNEKGEAVGVMSFIKFTGQNLNFAISSLEISLLKDDGTINQLTSKASIMAPEEILIKLTEAEKQFHNGNYQKYLDIILPVTKSLGGGLMKAMQKIAAGYFNLQQFDEALRYYKWVYDELIKIKYPNSTDVFKMAETLQSLSFCYFYLGDLDDAIKMVSQSIQVCKNGLKYHPEYKESYTGMLQLLYVADATYKHALNRDLEACLSWKMAKQYGYNKNDFGFDELCK